jgi:glycosyltransferase involved in cell wall biosynthesis
MKIKTFGFRGLVTPLFALENELIKLGHEIVDENTEADLCLNLMLDQEYEKTFQYKLKYPKCKLVLNLLNYPTDNPNYTSRLPDILSHADLITTVSEFTTRDIKKNTGFDSKVLYYPMKNITNLSLEKDMPFFYVGRLYSEQKRFWIIPKIFEYLKLPSNYFFVSGPEHTPFGNNLGFLEEKDLNVMYNRAKFILCPCSYEGSMMLIEGVVAGCFPVCCNDNNWLEEFGLLPFAADPNPGAIGDKIAEILNNQDKYNKILDELRLTYTEKMAVSNVAKRLVDFYCELI